MRTLILVASILISTPAFAGDDHIWNGGSDTASFQCTAQKGTVVLNGSSAKISISGPCKSVVMNGSSLEISIDSAVKVLVNGSHNESTIGHVAKISVMGSHNAIQWRSGLGKVKRPKVGNLGSNNTIKQAPPAKGKAK